MNEMSFINVKLRPKVRASDERVDEYRKMFAECNLPVDLAEREANIAEYFADENADLDEAMEELLDTRAQIEGEVARIAGHIDVLTYKTLAQALDEGKVKTVKIHSQGGSAMAGLAIYNIVSEANVRVEVEGIAHSAASIVAMAGKPLALNKGAVLGIHRPWSLAMGTAEDMRNEANALDVISASMIDVYQSRVKPAYKSKIAKMYDEDVLISGADAVKFGLADELMGDAKNKKRKAEGKEVVASNNEQAQHAQEKELQNRMDFEFGVYI